MKHYRGSESVYLNTVGHVVHLKLYMLYQGRMAEFKEQELPIFCIFEGNACAKVQNSISCKIYALKGGGVTSRHIFGHTIAVISFNISHPLGILGSVCLHIQMVV